MECKCEVEENNRFFFFFGGRGNIYTIFKVESLLIFVEYADLAHVFYLLGPNNDLIMGAT